MAFSKNKYRIYRPRIQAKACFREKTQRFSNRPAMILLIDPTDFTSPVSRVDEGFKYPGLEKWIRSELSNQKS